MSTQNSRPSFPGVTLYDPFHGDFTITSLFGVKRSYSSAGFHTGIDLVTPLKHGPIYPIYPGKVVTAKTASTGYGNVVVIHHSDLGIYSLYAHLNSIRVSAGQDVEFSDIIGTQGTTGNSTGDHLHLEIMTKNVFPSGAGYPANAPWMLDPSLYIKVVSTNYFLWRYNVGPKVLGQTGDFLNTSFSSSHYAVEPGTSYSVPQESAVPVLNPKYFSGGSSYFKSVVSEELLVLSEDEKRYGPSIVDLNQPVIKLGSDYNNTDKVLDGLREYAEFMYNYINLSSESASVSAICMPWLRPGTNVWVDPVRVDKVYYLNSVQHSGSRSGGCTTSLGLSGGRDRGGFEAGRYFGGLGSSSNLFLSEILTPVDELDNMGTIKKGQYHGIKEDALSHAVNDAGMVEKASNSEYYSRFYNVVDEDRSPFNTGTKFTSVDEIQSMLDAIYDSAPIVVKDRAERVEKAMIDAEEYVRIFYAGEFSEWR